MGLGKLLVDIEGQHVLFFKLIVGLDPGVVAGDAVTENEEAENYIEGEKRD